MTITWNKSRPERDPRRVWLDDKDCERMTRSGVEGVRLMLGALSYLAHARDDLSRGELERIPYGKQRMNMLIGGLRAIADDLIGTMTRQQCMQNRNTMKDMEIRIVPKCTPMGTSVVMEAELARDLTDKSRAACRECTKDGTQCRSCRLYQIMEATTPLEDYGNGMMCPYALAEWEDRK